MSVPLSREQLQPLELDDLNAIIKAHRGHKPGNPNVKSQERGIEKILEQKICVNWALVRAAQQRSLLPPGSGDPYILVGVDREVQRLVNQGKLDCPAEPSQTIDLPAQLPSNPPSAALPTHTSTSNPEPEPASHSESGPLGLKDAQEPGEHDVIVRLQDTTVETHLQKDIHVTLDNRGHDGWSSLVSAHELALKLLLSEKRLLTSSCVVLWNYPSSTQNPVPVLHCGTSGNVQFGDDRKLPIFEKNNVKWLHVFINKSYSDSVGPVLSDPAAASTTSTQIPVQADVEMWHQDDPLPPKPSPLYLSHLSSHLSPSPPSDPEASRPYSFISTPHSDQHCEDSAHQGLMQGSISSTNLTEPASGRSSPFSRTGSEQIFRPQDQIRYAVQDGSLDTALGRPATIDFATRTSTPDTSQVPAPVDPNPARPHFQPNFPLISSETPPPFTPQHSQPPLDPYSFSYGHGHVSQSMGDDHPLDSSSQPPSSFVPEFQNLSDYTTNYWNPAFQNTDSMPDPPPNNPRDAEHAATSNQQPTDTSQPPTDAFATSGPNSLLPLSPDQSSAASDLTPNQPSTGNHTGTSQYHPIVSSTSSSQSNPPSTSSQYVRNYLSAVHGHEVGIQSIISDHSRGKKPISLVLVIQQAIAVNKLCDLYILEATDAPGSKGIPPSTDGLPDSPASSTLIPVTLKDIADLIGRGQDWIGSCQRAVRKLQDPEVLNNPYNATIVKFFTRVSEGGVATTTDEKGGIGRLTGIQRVGPPRSK